MENIKEKVFCDMCGKECVSDGCGTGYGVNKSGLRICYDCCGKLDRKELQQMRVGDKIVLYLSIKTRDLQYGTTTEYFVTNWPGTLKIKARVKEGKHNIAKIRRDVWFEMEKECFHGVQYGNNSELCFIQKIKPRSQEVEYD